MKRIEPPLRITKPCSMDWNTMSGDERKRFCAGCGKHVFNLSAMTSPEAEAFAEETQGRECIAYVETSDGRIQSPGRMERFLMRLASRRPRWASALGMILPAALVACTQEQRQVAAGGVAPAPHPVKRQIREQKDGTMILGKICPPDKRKPAASDK